MERSHLIEVHSELMDRQIDPTIFRDFIKNHFCKQHKVNLNILLKTKIFIWQRCQKIVLLNPFYVTSCPTPWAHTKKTKICTFIVLHRSKQTTSHMPASTFRLPFITCCFSSEVFPCLHLFLPPLSVHCTCSCLEPTAHSHRFIVVVIYLTPSRFDSEPSPACYTRSTISRLCMTPSTSTSVVRRKEVLIYNPIPVHPRPSVSASCASPSFMFDDLFVAYFFHLNVMYLAGFLWLADRHTRRCGGMDLDESSSILLFLAPNSASQWFNAVRWWEI